VILVCTRVKLDMRVCARACVLVAGYMHKASVLNTWLRSCRQATTRLSHQLCISPPEALADALAALSTDFILAASNTMWRRSSLCSRLLRRQPRPQGDWAVGDVSGESRLCVRACGRACVHACVRAQVTAVPPCCRLHAQSKCIHHMANLVAVKQRPASHTATPQSLEASTDASAALSTDLIFAASKTMRQRLSPCSGLLRR
jgi:hypothetical protein